MGSGTWSTNVYSTAAAHRAATGTSAFAYSDSGARTVHASLDPHGLVVRESRDSDEHPNSRAVAVIFDVTGSMGRVPRILQTKLPGLLGLLLRRGYLTDPQILFGAIGDATCDRVPLQIGQFESDNRMDDHLGNIVLEGGGGGQMTESYELAMYTIARHTDIDCFNKRGQKGYLFLMGDELAYSHAKKREISKLLGEQVDEDIPIEQLVAELRRKWEVYFIIPDGGFHSADPRLHEYWTTLLGQNVIRLDDLEAVCETIALTIGLAEDAIDLDEGLADLDELGSTAGASVSKALAHVGPRSVTQATPGGAVATLRTDTYDGDDDVTRL